MISLKLTSLNESWYVKDFPEIVSAQTFKISQSIYFKKKLFKIKISSGKQLAGSSSHQTYLYFFRKLSG